MKGKWTGIVSLILLFFIVGCSSSTSGSGGEPDFPTKDIEFVAPASPGGGWDGTARAMQKIMSDEGVIEQNINVVNKPGGSGEVGWQYLRNQDAHSMAINSSLVITNNLLGQSDLTYEDFTPLGILTTEWISVAVSPDSEYEKGSEVMKQLKKDPKSLTIGLAPGLGNNDHLSFVQAAKEYGVDVPKLEFQIYKSGADVVTALLGGHIDVATMSVSEAKEQHKAGEINMIAVSSEERIDGLDEVPTWQEQGVDMVFPHWRGIMGPPDMTEEEIAYWDEKISQMIETDAWQTVLENNEWQSFYKDSEESRQYLEKQTQNYEELISEAGLTD
ncbi:tripartite tricarboxylate transporter substrate binding protein [Salibacterium halotolerans]|uniref:Tripartite-type tricarboxylate transporter, receptor component TctC n=1 Tax=Salibacterium halotolerans TaxID=1884432 RepID=A0A1I5RNS3_9BACI|nr:tripartite tricarboxylate transporter substrate binding protein [Salibacterium halotolerans]SFP59911.1 Tripartite-type tricarboxylate transporter, receptor component TctC [Salibacterium halotolerans]